MNPKQIGSYKYYDYCRFCKSKKISSVIDLGYVPLAGGFLKNINKESLTKEFFYPLTLSFCQNCYLLQTSNVINKDILFKNYYYNSSSIKTLVNHFENVTEELLRHLPQNIKPFIVEIGSNDGTLIKSSLSKGVKTLGIDPATNIVRPLMKQKLPIINDYFTEKLAVRIKKRYGQADIIFSSNTLAHIENMHDVARGIKILLKKNGMLIFETHYLGKLIKELQYDMIYHEHQYYYSLTTLKKFFKMHQMEIFDVKPIQIHAGSMRYYVQNINGGRKITNSVIKLEKREKNMKLDKKNTFILYQKKVEKTKKRLITFLTSLKKRGHEIIGYGASGRGSIIMNYCGLDSNNLSYIVDDAPAKQKLYTPGNHLRVYPPKKIYKNQVSYILLFAWSFSKEIISKHQLYIQSGGKFIIPLPRVRLLSKNEKK
ncbi:MAG: hypothetical protein COX79_04310 [Candidatus Levybacteria bacterium CG_4_10_14_0_2_um_filter_36_16]|nr:MAG: hypothetical protein AUK12_02250 [Candidatus Levybacteria bacterium CG2_30_37_29]PIR79133.1 MAG: hypothetical protein COU26_02745 [Candidatus Levybacteria bacterium CG10_big_fil_rev_8_21_14_0_10_36_30]PIZ96791.1 MAG: hypothetical protein COX79_04310 [Candidatus Levybacteria bacterium CG_4_10_14_0_2_um_filter_36_16]